MATPIFANDPRFVNFMEYQYRRLHEQNLFHPDPRYSESQARKIAFGRAMEARRKGLI